jgi:hypothetical protein
MGCPAGLRGRGKTSYLCRCRHGSLLLLLKGLRTVVPEARVFKDTGASAREREENGKRTGSELIDGSVNDAAIA